MFGCLISIWVYFVEVFAFVFRTFAFGFTVDVIVMGYYCDSWICFCGKVVAAVGFLWVLFVLRLYGYGCLPVAYVWSVIC